MHEPSDSRSFLGSSGRLTHRVDSCTIRRASLGQTKREPETQLNVGDVRPALFLAIVALFVAGRSAAALAFRDPRRADHRRVRARGRRVRC